MKILNHKIILATTLLLSSSLFIGSINAREFIPPNQAFKPSQQGNIITIEIADGYYLYQSKITAQSSSGPVDFIFLNKPIAKKFPNQGTHSVYLDKAKIKVNGNTRKPITLRYQGCSSQGLCYPPQQITLKAM